MTMTAGGVGMKMLSLFSGAGLMDLGFELEGFETTVAVEFDPETKKQWAVETWRRNRPGRAHVMCNADVRDLLAALRGDRLVQDPQMAQAVARLSPVGPAVVIGGPPCKSFSLAGKRKGRYDPETGGLAWAMVDIVAAFRPLAAVFENVEGLKTANGGDDLKLLVKAWEGAGYRPFVGTFNTADFGVPQVRRRVIILAVRADVVARIGKPLWPQPTHAKCPGQLDVFSGPKLPWVTVRQAIGDLPEPEESCYPLNKNDAARALGAAGGLRGGAPEGLHDHDHPARVVRGRKENYVPLPDGSVKNLRSGNVMGMNLDKPSNAVCAGEEKGGDRALMVPNHSGARVTTLKEHEYHRPQELDAPARTVDASFGSGKHEAHIPANHVLGRPPEAAVRATGDGRIIAERNARTVGVDPDAPAPTMRADVGHGDRGFVVPANHGVVDPDEPAPSMVVQDGAKIVQTRQSSFRGGPEVFGVDEPSTAMDTRGDQRLIEVPNHASPSPLTPAAEENRMRQLDDPHDGFHGGIHVADEPAATVMGCKENFVAVPNHAKFVRLKPEQVARVLESGKFNPARDDRPSPTIKATMHKGAQNDEPYIVESYRVLRPEEPSHAITAHAGRSGDADPCIVETNQTGPSSALDTTCQRQIASAVVRLRRLTVRECARLQSVPDHYVFYGPITSCYRQVGNGLPVLFAQAVAKALREYLAAWTRKP